jgi:hypothetical protein
MSQQQLQTAWGLLGPHRVLLLLLQWQQQQQQR